MISSLITQLGKELPLNDLGRLHYFLGIEVIYHNNSLFLNQTRYAVNLLDREHILDCKPLSTPLPPNHHLHKDEESTVLSNAKSYRRIVGALQYLTTIRPDLAYVVNLVCQYMHSPLFITCKL